MLQRVKEWHTVLKNTFTTPDYDHLNPRDVEMYTHLATLSSGAESIRSLIDQYFELDQEEKLHESAIKEKVKRKDGIKVKIKDWFDSHSVEELDSLSGVCYATMTVKETEFIDPEKLKADGIDPNKYKSIKQTKTFTVKKKKKE